MTTDSVHFFDGRVEAINNLQISGWLVDLSTSDEAAIVDLYLGDIRIASTRPNKPRGDVVSHFKAAGRNIQNPNVHFTLDATDCTFSDAADAIKALTAAIDKKRRVVDFVKVRLRRTGFLLPHNAGQDLADSTLSTIKDLLTDHIQNIANKEPFLGRCIAFRKLLERIGVWCGPNLSEKEMDLFRDDPIGLCVDAAFLDFSPEDTAGAVAFYRLMSHRHPIRPNAIFDDLWYVTHNSEVHKRIASGLCQSGLDAYLQDPDALSTNASVCWIAPDAGDIGLIDLLKIEDLHSLVDKELFGNEATSSVPEIFVAQLTNRPRSGADLARSNPNLSVSDWQDRLLEDGVFHNRAELGRHLFHTIDLKREGTFDSLGFRQEDRRIILFNTNSRTRNLHITRQIEMDAQRLLGADNVLYATHLNLVATCRDNPDAFLVCVDGQRMSMALISRARRYAAATVLWTFDDPYNLKDHVAAEEFFDLIFTNDSSAPTHYGSKGIFLPLAASAAEADRPPENRAYDIFFCGTAWPNRVVLLNRLMADRPQYRYKIALTYNPHIPAVPLDAPISDYVRTLSSEYFMAYARRSTITLALHRNFSGTDKLSVSSSPGPRMFEVALTRSFQISENAGEDFKTLFPEAEVDYFGDYPALLKSVDAALKSEQTQARADVLHQRVSAQHTYMNRLSTMLIEISRETRGRIVVNRSERKPRVLCVVHNTINADTFGGLEIHQDLIKENLKGDHEFFFFFSRVTEQKREFVLTDFNYNVLHSDKTSDLELHEHLENRSIEKIFSRALNKFDFDGVHFFHFMHNVPSLAHITRAAGIPYVISIHDYYTACRQFNLIDHNKTYCNNTFDRVGDCDICLFRQFNFPVGSQVRRRDYYLEVLSNAASVIFVSENTREKFQEIYPQLDYTSSRIHGAPIPNSTWRFQRILENDDKRESESSPKVVICGNFEENKGAQYFIDAISICADVNLEFHFHGGAHEAVRAKVVSLLGDRATFHGRYNPGGVDLGKYDFSLHLSNWPETYCQTLSEAWAANLVPIVTDIGALGARVTEGVTGLKCDPKRPATLGHILRQIAKTPDDYLTLRENISDDLFVTQEEQADLYRSTYCSLFTAPRSHADLPLAQEGFDLSQLQRTRRNARWSSAKNTHPEDKITLPARNYLSEADSIEIWTKRVDIISRGAIDLVRIVGSEPPEGRDVLEVKNDQAIHIRGWAMRPSVEAAHAYKPVIVVTDSLKESSEAVIFQANSYSRPDLVKNLNNDDAKNWAINGTIRLLNIRKFLAGNLEISVGWRNSLTGQVSAYRLGKTINMRYGG